MPTKRLVNMSTSSTEPAEIDTTVAGWLTPLDDEPCGPDLEYDADVLELGQTATGKPETQFSAAEPPQWSLVLEQSAAVMNRTRDLRIAIHWIRAKINLEGLPALLPGLQLFTGLLENFWEPLHPLLDPDDGDAFARISVLGSLDKLDGLLGDVRQALVLPDRRLGGLRVRDTEIALDRLAPRADETTRSKSEMANMFGELPELAVAVRTNVQHSLDALKQLQRVMNDRFGIGQGVEVKALRVMLDGVLQVTPAPEAAAGDGEGDEGGGGSGFAPAARSGGGGGGGSLNRIDSRKDAIRAIRLVCEFLERSEPTNPAQLLLRRAERLIEKNFLQLVRELAPDAMAEVARVMGVDPDSISSED